MSTGIGQSTKPMLMLRNNNGGAQPSTLDRSTIVFGANPQYDQISVKFEKQVAEVRAQRGEVDIDEAVIDGRISKLTMEYEQVNLKLEKLRVEEVIIAQSEQEEASMRMKHQKDAEATRETILMIVIVTMLVVIL
jgi:hypothetical protein